MSETHAYPLCWPFGSPRKSPADRRPSQFKKGGKPITIHAATGLLTHEIRLLGGSLTAVSSNVELRHDGLPRSDGRPLNDDPGVVVFFDLSSGKSVAIPCDTFHDVGSNIRAVAFHVEDMRRALRHGVGTVEQMFAGFLALPAPGKRPWMETLGFLPGEPVTRQMVLLRRTELAKLHHPDVAGGSHARMAEINAAAERALAELALKAA